MILVNAVIMVANSIVFYLHFYKILKPARGWRHWLDIPKHETLPSEISFYILSASPILLLHLLRLFGAINQQFTGTIADGCLNYQDGFLTKTPFQTECLGATGMFELFLI